MPDTHPRMLAMVLAGGEGTRLFPLTAERSKPAVPFGGRYRIVDFVLSNLVNSGVYAIYLLVQYKSQSLIEHITSSWTLSPILPHQFIAVVPPQMREGPEWFQGTADAVHQNLNLINANAPDLVAVLGADHIYRMDLRQMADFHHACGADATVAALPVPISQASSFGVIGADADGRIRGFLEKPAQPPSMPGDTTRAFASMGNYLFSTDVLVQAVNEARQRGESDFGLHILPRLVHSHRIFAYDFSDNRVPGLRDYEEPHYWRDVGTIDTYFDAHQDTLGLEPRFNLFNTQWPVGSSNYQGPNAKLIDATVRNASIGAGTLVKSARIRNSVVRHEVLIEEDVELEDCIIMDYVVIRRGAKLRRTIVDRYNTIAAGSRIGYDLDGDRRRYFVTDSGIVVIRKGPYCPWIGSYH
ncbi:MAG: glucose-1-phosphate adenylyltransferase [Burkholderiales bacterium]